MKDKNKIMDTKGNNAETPMSAHCAYKKRLVFKAIIVIALVVVIGAVLAQSGLISAGNFPLVPASDWQAVFLNNNQVYFGHLRSLDRDYVDLSNVFYLRVAQPPLQGQGAGAQPTLNLVKLGGELHGPQDTMYIPKTQVMFWENMATSSQVVQAINNYYALQPKQ